jgi:hypothetical protein
MKLSVTNTLCEGPTLRQKALAVDVARHGFALLKHFR